MTLTSMTPFTMAQALGFMIHSSEEVFIMAIGEVFMMASTLLMEAGMALDILIITT